MENSDEKKVASEFGKKDDVKDSYSIKIGSGKGLVAIKTISGDLNIQPTTH